ncbi:UNVERIFIED_CONTAM: hypothetical protein GTU68_041342 [Idotea baltica]|nr:hypothetical protein [Idotea baltica]
MIKILIH